MNRVMELADAADARALETVNDPNAAAMQELRESLNHKLRTPLNAIIGFAELLTLQADNKRKDADIKQILQAAREMLQVIERELCEANAARPFVESGTDNTASTRTCDVLYVEDDSVNFMLMERIMEYRPKVQLIHAPQGGLGLQLAEAYRPKLILLDLNLPDMSGDEVLRRLQSQPETKDLPVVILSANASPSKIERLLAGGARNYLTKPFNIDHFLTVVDEFVS